jgi:hypothetical protein
MDRDADGLVTDEELTTAVEKMTNDTNSFLLNFGVIAALLMTMVYPCLLTPVILSDASVEYFGEGRAYMFGFTYYIGLSIVAASCVTIIYMSAEMYNSLNFRMVRNNHSISSARVTYPLLGDQQLEAAVLD